MPDPDLIQNYLDDAEKAVKQKEAWAVVESYLIQAESAANDARELRGSIHLKRTYLTVQRNHQIKTLYQLVEERLETERPLMSTSIRDMLRQIEQMAIDSQEASSRVRVLEQKVERVENEVYLLQKYTEFADTLDKQWQKGREELRTDRPAEEIIDSYFKKSYEDIQAFASQHTQYGPLQNLLRQAKERYDDEREIHDMPTTYSALGKWEDLLREFETLLRDDPERRVQIQDDNGQNRYLPVREAISIVQRRVANSRKVRILDDSTGYLAIARRYLADHNPRAAEQQLQEALSLQPDDDTQYKINAVRREVDAELSRLDTADQYAESALNNRNLENAWMVDLQNAVKTYEWSERVKRVKDSLQERAYQEFQNTVQNIENIIQAGHLEEAEREIHKLQQEKIYPEILGSRQQDITVLKQSIKNIYRERSESPEICATLRTLVNDRQFVEANQQLEAFLSKYPNAEKRDAILYDLYRRITAQVNIERLVHELDRAYHSNDVNRIREGLEDAKTAVSANAELAGRYNIPSLRDHLEGRMRVLEAENLWLHEEDLSAAGQLLQNILGSSAAPADKKRALELFSQIQKSEAAEQRFKNLIGIIEENLRDGVYDTAYQRLMPFKDAVLTRGARHKRDELWGNVTDALANTTEQDLHTMLINETDELAKFVEKRDLLLDLGVRIEPHFKNQIEERIAVLESEHREQIKDWQGAEASWLRACQLNDSNIEHQKRYRQARREHIRSDLNRLMSSDEKLADAYILTDQYRDELPNDVEPRVWQIEVVVQQAYSAEEPRTFDTRWRHCNSLIALTEGLIERQPPQSAQIPEEQAARDQLQKWTKIAAKGRDNGRIIQGLERLLTSRQSLETLRSAIEQIERLLQEHAVYRGIAHWWMRHQQQLVGELENTARENAGQFWQSFIDYARLGVIIPRHDEAIHIIQEMPRRIPELLGQVETTVSNDKAPIHSSQVDENVVVAHIEETRVVERYVLTAITSLNFFKSTFEAVDVKEIIQTLNQAANRIGGKTQSLRILDDEYRQALTLAATQGIKNNWEEFDRQFEKIEAMEDGRYQHHQALAVLRERKEVIRGSRTQINELVTRLKEEFDRQNIDGIRQVLAQLEHEDPDDQYEVQRRQFFETAGSQDSLRGVEALREWLEIFDDEVQPIIEWLSYLITTDALKRLMNKDRAALRQLRDQRVMNEIHAETECLFVHWHAYRMRLDELCRKGAYQQAYKEVNQLFADDLPSGELLSLQMAKNYIEDMGPIRGIRFRYQHSKLLQQLQQELQHDLSRAVNEAQQYKQRILQDAEQFVQLLADFDNKLRDVTRNQRPADINQGRELHAQIKTLAAEYPGLYDLEQYQQLKQTK